MGDLLCAVLAKAGLAIAEVIITKVVMELCTAYIRRYRADAATAAA
ncbi:MULTISPECIES: hypothetical protein [Streptomyces]|uniref:Uncharacterized protein n=1 Tax=Streptomyces olivaceiscleroticus TaxID=68245 RepID=A0ABP3LFE5_9ACTN|nr:hypothetical protein [Streptomyces niger]